MNHRLFLLPALGSLFGLFGSGRTARQPPRRPNIVFILADDLGDGDLSGYGAPGGWIAVLRAELLRHSPG